jgi:hypothetical protein
MPKGLLRPSYPLLFGDSLAFILITLVGFASHERLSFELAGRMLATFLPFFGAWLLIIPWMGLHKPKSPRDTNTLWRVPLAVIFAAPLGGWLRGLLLNTPIMPVFILVMAGVMTLTMCAWRFTADRFLSSTPPT